ncbi:biopolymer transporter ExbD [Mameliella sediminis]|uniref:biopolymer transporter ExbD n=1 Tax=Mameliella sediminis TaxID=2836866 RepID=UPI001C49587C|nr:biopolymer transporter ExbD [Mameliella sediminis]MBY6117224.1 biopolymer transporter ExbD [Antarctobacter heliothermus]MBY6147080.1 biopolymer transporter ExbD [Mameliella alba]MBV7397067.1 biopolymer transporter ExbD [Mameliella sediminis]MBY6161936.1 biopolymer transporter ExbD [Mameliella alba]MBY6170406.1 biopolymer transporter ExbD [Mameliella alba]
MFTSRLTSPRRFWPGPPKPRAEPVVPMINIVFLLLIFFLLTAHFADPGSAGRSQLAVDEPPDTARPLLILAPSGLVTFGTLRGPEAISAAATAGPVRLLTDQATEARHLARALTLLAQAGAGRVDLVTTGGTTE